MKTIRTLMLATLLMAASNGMYAHAHDHVKASAASNHWLSVTVDGKTQSLSQPMKNVSGRLLMPLHALMEAAGASGEYQAKTKTITLTKGGNTLVLKANEKAATVNGYEVALDVAPLLDGKDVLVPIRFAAEHLGFAVRYEQATGKVSLEARTTPSFKVVGPAEGSVLHTDTVKVGVAVYGHELADFRTHMQPKEAQGHVHLWLDTDPSDPKLAYKLIGAEPAVFEQVKPGDHTLTIQLVGNDHKPVKPEVKQVIRFTTKAASPQDHHTVAPAAGTSASTSTKAHVPAKPAQQQAGAAKPATQQGEPKASPPQPAKQYAVAISGFAYGPNQLTVEAGATVTFTNADEAEHTVTDQAGTFDSGALAKGESFSHTFAKPGVYHLYCKPHPFMTATITVK